MAFCKLVHLASLFFCCQLISHHSEINDHLLDVPVLLLPLPLLLLGPRELFLAWSPTGLCMLPVSVTRHEHVDLSSWPSPRFLHRTKVPEHRHTLQLTSNIVGHVETSQRKAVFRDDCFVECNGAEVCRVFLTLGSASYPQPLWACPHLASTSTPTSVCLNRPIPCL